MIESNSKLSYKDNMESTMVDINTLNKHPVQFTAQDLSRHLEPIIEKMIASEHSYQFQQPVDSVAFNIPDYPTIIKHPMDISTIRNKLLGGEYKNPLEFCNDAWLMFNNAWLYNNRSLRIYRSCTKLAELFVESIDPVIQALGYCCGCQYTYFPNVMLCYGNKLCCQISLNDNYYYYNNPEPSQFNLSNNKYTYCVKCFDSVKNDSIFVGDDPTQTLIQIPKSLFLLAKNYSGEPEPMIDCIVCTRRFHQVCALDLDQIWPEGFICNTCIHQYNLKRKQNPYVASKLSGNDLASRLEQRVNDFLRNEDCQTGYVTIRILAETDKICQVKPQLKKYYPNQVVNGYPYRTKAIFAFQQIEGVDVVFFGMYLQEYDEHCPAPNTRRVYISLFDTVPFFQPKIHQKNVYHEILIGYLDYAKQHGYIYAHLWTCPPSHGIDYIFYRHPPEQHMLNQKSMNDWCKEMLNKAILEHIIINYKVKDFF
jgi:E1A/CREB-binding protein